MKRALRPRLKLVIFLAMLAGLGVSGCEKGEQALTVLKNKFTGQVAVQPQPEQGTVGHRQAVLTEQAAAEEARHTQSESHDTAVQTAETENHEAGAEHTNHADDHHGSHEAGEELKLSADELAAAGIRVEKIELQDNPEQIAVTGVIKANQDRLAHVQVRLPGRVVAVTGRLGDQVTQGQTLATLDSVDLNEAATAYLQMQSELSLAEANFKRASKLYTDRIVPQREYLIARTEKEKARNAQRAAAGKLELFGIDPARVGNSRAALVFPLTSPFAGTIIEKHVAPGEYAEPGTSLFTVADLSTLWIETSIFDKDLSRIRTGLEASVSVTAYPQASFRGRITYIGSMMDEETRTVSARVELVNADNRLKAGMFASVFIDSGAGAAALLVPDDAVVLIDGEPTVFVAGSAGFEPRVVQTGKRAGGRVRLESGIAAGESVAVSGAYALKSRMLKSELGEGHAH